MHGHEADLRSIANDDKYERKLHQVRVEAHSRDRIHQRNPVQRSSRIHACLDRGQIQHNGTEQRECDSYGANDQILPTGFDRPFRIVKTDEERGCQRRSFHHDPQKAEVCRQTDADHREEKQEDERIKPPRG